MREQGLAARRKKKRRSTTRPGKGRWRAPDLVKRDFPAQQLNRKWYGDGTEIPTGQGKLYLASVLDMASRRVLGFALGEHHDAQLAYGALAMAVAVRGGQVPGVILHTDQGSEYTAGAFRAACPGWASPSRWAGPGPRWTTRSSNPGTRPWSSSSARWSTSPPGRRPGPGSPPGSTTTTTAAGTPRCQMMSPVDYERAWRPGRRPEMPRFSAAEYAAGARPCQGRSSLDRACAPAVIWQLSTKRGQARSAKSKCPRFEGNPENS